MRLEFSNSCFFPRVLLRKGNIVSLSVTASFSRLFRTLIFFRPQRLRAFALHSTAENAQEKSTATENDRHPRKTKSEPGTPTCSLAFFFLALSQLSRPCPFWLAFTTTPSATRELPPSPKKLQTNCGGGTHAARRSLRTPFPRHTYTLLFFSPSRNHRTRSRWPAEPPRCS